MYKHDILMDMNSHLSGKWTLGLISFIAVWHLFGVVSNFYETTLWCDVVTHFLGGEWIVFVLKWLLDLGFLPRSFGTFFVLISVVFVGGILWEVFEIVGGITAFTQTHYWFETVKDVCVDVLGGCLGYQIVCKVIDKK